MNKLSQYWIIISASSMIMGLCIGAAGMSRSQHRIAEPSNVAESEPVETPPQVVTVASPPVAKFPAVDMTKKHGAFAVPCSVAETGDLLIGSVQATKTSSSEVAISLEANNKTKEKWSPWIKGRIYNSYGVMIGENSVSNLFDVVPGERRFLTISVRVMTWIESDYLRMSEIKLGSDFSSPAYLELTFKDGKKVICQ